MYEISEGIARDLAKAATWYEQAARQGHAEAQLNLGVLFENGEGVPQSDERAAYWYSTRGAGPGPRDLGQARLRMEAAKEKHTPGSGRAAAVEPDMAVSEWDASFNEPVHQVGTRPY